MKSRLYNVNCSCCFFGGTTFKHFHHYIRPTLNEADVTTDIAVFHVGTNDIINSEVIKILQTTVSSILMECVAFGVKNVFISSLMVNTRCNSAFISAGNKSLRAKCLIPNFRFIDNSNIKKETSLEGLFTLKSFRWRFVNKKLRDVKNFLRNLKDQEIVT